MRPLLRVAALDKISGPVIRRPNTFSLALANDEAAELRDTVANLSLDPLYRQVTQSDILRYGLELAVAAIRGHIEITATASGPDLPAGAWTSDLLSPV